MRKVLIVMMLLATVGVQAALVKNVPEAELGEEVWLTLDQPVNIMDKSVTFEGMRNSKAKLNVDGYTDYLEVGDKTGMQDFDVTVIERGIKGGKVKIIAT